MRLSPHFPLALLLSLLACSDSASQRPAPQASESRPESATGQATEKRKPEDQIIFLLGVALTEQYKKTPWGVRVYGDDEQKTLSFDCSDDPNPKDVCFMLYKQYPDDSETRVLRMMGVKRIYYHSGGLLEKSWQKELSRNAYR